MSILEQIINDSESVPQTLLYKIINDHRYITEEAQKEVIRVGNPKVAYVFAVFASGWEWADLDKLEDVVIKSKNPKYIHLFTKDIRLVQAKQLNAMSNKKAIREQFRNEVLKRDGNRCKICGISGVKLDVHHITSRKEMPNGGYVKENGISLCESHHLEAETYLQTGEGELVLERLYKLIDSTYELAVEKSLLLENG